MQNWHKLGLIHRPDTSKEWAANGYCHVPTPIVLGDIVRVYYASLDANNRGSIGFVDLDGGDLTKVKHVSPEPVLRPGPLGAFDCDGVVPSCVLNGNIVKLFYIGFQRCEAVPYMLFSGMAISIDDGTTYDRVSDAPTILDRTTEDPFSRSAPFVMDEEHRMWYWSCSRWENGRYHNIIKHVGGNRLISACLAPEAPDYALGRPWVIKEDGIYKMWYSIRRDGTPEYRMGYAESPDGLEWEHKDGEVAALNVLADGDTAEYPSVIDVGGKRVMFFNGKQHGKFGIELAVLDAD